ncbi:helix-turn-helix domain-containing protein [Celeribacter ethanolicus]|uniref:Helix-turn-helix domain-containing protein n=1 Tax=Celeribacter ethanolicus TaxID=1758178 RepID=A0A291G8X7_9RHOB|nr:helix-turn-helix domain-containing protein [Celeribacter ethanolicus]ATG46631.1 helix-turn-helix domain-containing protein [Celeribacter ethanolicus]
MTSDNKDTDQNKVVQLRPPKAKAGLSSERKWGKKVIDLGFCIVPSLLLRAQQRLGLNPTQLAVLLQLCDFWWEEARKPHPGVKTLAQRLSLSERQVRRYIADLEKAGLVQRIERHAGHGGKQTNIYDLSGLVKRLKELEPEFREVEDDAKAERKAVTKRGYRRTKKTAVSKNEV